MRLIDADALKVPSEEMIAKMVIDSAPTIDAVPVRHGKWIDTQEKEEWYGSLYKCSLCGSGLIETDNYCPKCGARMDAEREEE